MSLLFILQTFFCLYWGWYVLSRIKKDIHFFQFLWSSHILPLWLLYNGYVAPYTPYIPKIPHVFQTKSRTNWMIQNLRQLLTSWCNDISHNALRLSWQEGMMVYIMMAWWLIIILSAPFRDKGPSYSALSAYSSIIIIAIYISAKCTWVRNYFAILSQIGMYVIVGGILVIQCWWMFEHE